MISRNEGAIGVARGIVTLTRKGNFLAGFLIAAAIGTAQAQTITSLDYPGALATAAFAINKSGAITGEYADTNKVGHLSARRRARIRVSMPPTQALPARGAWGSTRPAS